MDCICEERRRFKGSVNEKKFYLVTEREWSNFCAIQSRKGLGESDPHKKY